MIKICQLCQLMSHGCHDQIAIPAPDMSVEQIAIPARDDAGGQAVGRTKPGNMMSLPVDCGA